MPFAIFDYMGAFLRNGFAHVDNVNCYPRDQSNRMAAPVKVARQQTTPRNSPEPSEPCLRNLHQHTPELSGTFEPAYLHQHTPELSGTFRNLPSLPPEPTPAYTGTLRNLAEPSGTCLSGTFRNLPPEPTPAYAGTFRNLRNPPPEPTPAHAGTLRNLPEPSSGTCSCDPHRHTPELIWAEDPSSLRCWGKNSKSWWFGIVLVFYDDALHDDVDFDDVDDVNDVNDVNAVDDVDDVDDVDNVDECLCLASSLTVPLDQWNLLVDSSFTCLSMLQLRVRRTRVCCKTQSHHFQ